MSPRRRAAAARLVGLIALMLLAMWALYRLFIALPPAPPPRVRTGAAPPAENPTYLAYTSGARSRPGGGPGPRSHTRC